MPAPIRFFPLLFLCAIFGCDRKPASSASAPPTHEPRVASLVPAATDLLLEMGAGDHLVAVSNYDSDPRVEKLPRAGAYENTDWELLANLKPRYMILQIALERLPAGFQQRADALGIQFRSLKLDRLDDVYQSLKLLGDLTGEQTKAAALDQRIRAQLDAIRARVGGQPRVRVLIVIDPTGHDLAGGGTFFDDLLQIAGGDNAAAGLTSHYPSVDREQLIALKPDVILQLLPGASPQVRQSAAEAWKQMPEIPAVKNGRVCILTEPYAEIPGAHVGDLAEKFADCLHPPQSHSTTTAPSARLRESPAAPPPDGVETARANRDTGVSPVRDVLVGSALADAVLPPARKTSAKADPTRLRSSRGTGILPVVAVPAMLDGTPSKSKEALRSSLSATGKRDEEDRYTLAHLPGVPANAAGTAATGKMPVPRGNPSPQPSPLSTGARGPEGGAA